RITLISDEPHTPYDRPPLSKDLLKDPSASAVKLELLSPKQCEDPQLEMRLGATATALNVEERRVLVDTEAYPYDYLVIATGSRARKLPLPKPLEGIYTLRTR